MDIANKSMEEKFMNHEVKEKQDLLNAQGISPKKDGQDFPYGTMIEVRLRLRHLK